MPLRLRLWDGKLRDDGISFIFLDFFLEIIQIGFCRLGGLAAEALLYHIIGDDDALPEQEAIHQPHGHEGTRQLRIYFLIQQF